MVLAVVHEEAVLGHEIAEAHQSVTYRQHRVVVDPILVGRPVEDAADVVLQLVADDVFDALVLELLDRRQARRTRSDDADARARHGEGLLEG